MVHPVPRRPEDPRGESPLTVADLMDADWYLAEYPDVSTADPLRHYMTEGWRQGRDPGPLFDTDWFVAAYPAAEARAGGPLPYFLEWGSRRLLRPNPLFDPDWYASTYPQVVGGDPFTHYVRSGRDAGLLPSAAVADVMSTAIGQAEGRCARTTVVIQAGDDFIHADRCLRALMDVHGWQDVLVVTDDPRDGRWQWWMARRGVDVIHRDEELAAHVTEDVDFVLLLRPSTEPTRGLVHRLVEQHRELEGRAADATVICPRARAALIAPGIRSDWWRLRDLRSPPQAALVSSERWRVLMAWPPPGPGHRRDEHDDLIHRAVSTAGSVVTDGDVRILSHLPMSVASLVRRQIPSWDPMDSPGLTLLTVAAAHPVATVAMLAWLQVAACNLPAAVEDLRRWRALLQSVSPATHATLPRLVRRRDQLVDEIIQECLVQPSVTRSAAAAIADRDRESAMSGLARHPDSYPAAVAVVTLGPRSRSAPAEISMTGSPEIPTVIIQGWFDSPLPSDAAALARTWSGQHPRWRHLVVDTGTAASWIREHLGAAAMRTFLSAPPVGKSNLFRYAYLSVDGGVWADIDDRCLKHISPLLQEHSLVVTRESIGAVADNFIAVAPGHPALVATREEAFRNVAEGFGESPWLANGPGLFTRKVAAWIAGLLPGNATGYRLVPGPELAEYVAMHEDLGYKETDLAWDVPEEPGDVETGWGQALSPRQHRLREAAQW